MQVELLSRHNVITVLLYIAKLVTSVLSLHTYTIPHKKRFHKSNRFTHLPHLAQRWHIHISVDKVDLLAWTAPCQITDIIKYSYLILSADNITVTDILLIGVLQVSL